MSITAMKMALEALENPWEAGANGVADAITALRQAIAQAEQAQPVAWMNPSWIDPDTRGWQSHSFEALPIEGWLPLYTTTPQRKPLNAMEVYDVVRNANLDWHTGFALGEDENRFVVFARAIEAAHGIKE